MIGCNNSLKNVSGTIFKKEFELGMNQTMKQSRYLGETNDIFYLSHKTRSIISGAWKEEIWHAKSEDLEPGFMNKLREFNKNKETKLINATKKGDLETVKTYLKEGIDINTRDSDNGYSILHWAAEKGQKKIVKLLIEKGANLNAKTKNNLTPLNLADNNFENEISELLIKNGATEFLY
jgi:ankyrin repeat protein